MSSFSEVPGPPSKRNGEFVEAGDRLLAGGVRGAWDQLQCGGSRQRVLLDKQDYEGFLKTIGEVHDRWPVEVFAYRIMGNHYHVCLRTPEGNLSRVMQHLDGLYTQRFNRLHRRDGALFRERYKAIVVDKDSYLAQEE